MAKLLNHLHYAAVMVDVDMKEENSLLGQYKTLLQALEMRRREFPTEFHAEDRPEMGELGAAGTGAGAVARAGARADPVEAAAVHPTKIKATATTAQPKSCVIA